MMNKMPLQEILSYYILMIGKSKRYTVKAPWPRKKLKDKVLGPLSIPEADSQLSNKRTGQVIGLLPNGKATCWPAPFWSVLLRDNSTTSPSRVNAICSTFNATSSLRLSAPAQPITRSARSRWSINRSSKMSGD